MKLSLISIAIIVIAVVIVILYLMQPKGMMQFKVLDQSGKEIGTIAVDVSLSPNYPQEIAFDVNESCKIAKASAPVFGIAGFECDSQAVDLGGMGGINYITVADERGDTAVIISINPEDNTVTQYFSP